MSYIKLPKKKKIRLPAIYDKLTCAQRMDVREEYVERQKGKCYFCKGSLEKPPTKEIMDYYLDEKLFPKDFFNHPIHLHHDHDSGNTIGAVHARCNAVLWVYFGE